VPDETANRSGGEALALRRRPLHRVVVRQAGVRDLSTVSAFRLALLREESRNPFFANPHPDAERRALRLTRKELVARDQVILVAERNGETVGILRCRAVRRSPLVAGSRHAVVTTVFVRPDHRRKGVLRALLREADGWCRRRRIRDMRLQCALSNETGRRAWESLGFRPAEVLYLRSIPPA
jgi:GNAT superfamily N-acetyltransferase